MDIAVLAIFVSIYLIFLGKVEPGVKSEPTSLVKCEVADSENENDEKDQGIDNSNFVSDYFGIVIYRIVI